MHQYRRTGRSNADDVLSDTAAFSRLLISQRLSACCTCDYLGRGSLRSRHARLHTARGAQRGQLLCQAISVREPVIPLANCHLCFVGCLVFTVFATNLVAASLKPLIFKVAHSLADAIRIETAAIWRVIFQAQLLSLPRA